MNIENIVKATLGTDAFWSVNKALARRIGIEEAALTAEIISKHSYWKARNGLDEQGGFFMTSEDIQAVMGIGDKPVARLTKSILIQGVVKIKKRGVPAKNYWYPQWVFIFSLIDSDPQTGVTGDTLFGVTGEAQTGVAITKNTNEKWKPKKSAGSKAAPPALYARIVKLIADAHKHLTGEDLIWKGHEKKYGQACVKIMEIVAGQRDDELAFQMVRNKCAGYCQKAEKDTFLKGQGVTPISLLSNWNKIQYDPAKGSMLKIKKNFPDYRTMSSVQITEAFTNWNEHFNNFDLKEHLSAESYRKYMDGGAFAPTLIQILIDEVQTKKSA